MKQMYRQTAVQSSHQDTMFSVLLLLVFLYPDPSSCIWPRQGWNVAPGGHCHLSLPPRHNIASYTKVRVLVISSNGVVDSSDVTVEEQHEDCKKPQQSNKNQNFYMNLIVPWRTLLFKALPVILAIIFLVLLLFLICCKKQNKDISEHGECSRNTDANLLHVEEMGEELSEKTFHPSLY